MITFDIVFTGRLLSEQGRDRNKSVSPIITNRFFQDRLKSVAPTIGSPYVSRRTIQGVEYVALFDEKWMLKLEVQFFVNPPRHQRGDMDHIWRPLQNALAFPNPNLKVIGASKGDCFRTVAVDDSQFTQVKLETICHFGCLEDDLTLVRVTALKPPHLELAFPPPAPVRVGKG